MMTRLNLFLCAALVTTALVVPSAIAREDRQAASARAAAEQGQVIPLGRLIDMVQSRAPFRDMRYLGGPQYDPASQRYTLRFLDGAQVVLVLVDARTGRVLAQSR